MLQLIGGPYDGMLVDAEDDNVFVKMSDGRYAQYCRITMDGEPFAEDGNYHFQEIIDEEELEPAED